jgi:UDP-3-O-[3-hydroxymyristoyl] glucosamine N-acyltransferase
VQVQGEFSLGDLAVRFGLELQGEPGLRVTRVATLSNAERGALSFLANPRYRKQMESTRATAVLVAPEHAAACPVAALIDPNPYLAYARIAELLHPQVPPTAGIHASAVVSASARIAPSAGVGPLAVIEDDADIGERVFVGPGCVVQRGARIGDDSRLISRVSLYPGVSLGRRCIVHAGAVVGADGFGFAPDAGSWVKVPQVGSVQIGDDVEIGANTTIDRGAIDDTVVEHGVKLDNQIQVGHNVTIGAHTAVAGCVGISGSTTIGRRCMIGGGVGIAGHLTIADDVVVTGCSLVSASLRYAGSYSSGMPAVETRLWRRMVAHLRRLDSKER